MKIYLFPVVIGGFIITFILQAAMFASVGLQNTRLQKQSDDLAKKLDKYQLETQSEITSEILKIKNGNLGSVNKSTDLSGTETTMGDSDLLSAENLSKTLGATTGTGTSAVSLKSSWDNVDVYESSKASSKVVGKIKASTSYPIIEKIKDWYKISLDSQASAWVQAQFVYETI